MKAERTSRAEQTLNKICLVTALVVLGCHILIYLLPPSTVWVRFLAGELLIVLVIIFGIQTGLRPDKTIRNAALCLGLLIAAAMAFADVVRLILA